ncbi:MAG: TonB-dependent siderophore receptor [Bryobacteraceae bacterium]
MTRTLAVCLLVSASLFGQEPLVIRVLDETGAIIPEALVSAHSVHAETVAPGVYRLRLSAGEHTIAVSKDGFVEVRQSISIQPGNTRLVDIVLHVEGSRNAVTVIEGSPYLAPQIDTATRTPTPLRDVPQAITVITQQLTRDQSMISIADVVRYVPGVTAHQGENNRDQIVIRGNNSSSGFFVDAVRDDAQYFRDLYNLERVEALKGPNAMIFGRGGGGGVINRVTKRAAFAPLREVTIQGGSFTHKRAATDLNQPFGERAAARLNAMFEDSASFRDFAALRRWAVNPALTLRPREDTGLDFSYEHLDDHRTADRGIPSFQGWPVNIPLQTFFGNPDDSRVRAEVDHGSIALDRQFGSIQLRNRFLTGDYRRFYRNYVPGAVSPDRRAILTAYDNASERSNLFNQTDVVSSAITGRLRQTLLAGAELGHQATNNFRNTGFFDGTVTSISVPLDGSVLYRPATFRQNPTDADNRVNATVVAVYLQDQVEISRNLQAIAGLRYDRFRLLYRNHRTAESLRRVDHLVSPRAGLVFKPASGVSVYGSYSVSYLPSSGDQFSSLTAVTEQVKPERFRNYEAGVKWDLARSLSVTAAAYRLDRTNTRSIDPNDPTRIVQTGAQRTEGFEFGASGSLTRRWNIAGGYAFQNARVTSATAAAKQGAWVDQVPRHSFSLWNHYQAHRRLGLGLGLVNRTRMFAAIDDAVILLGYTRADAAAFVPLGEKLRLQANAENVTNAHYFLNANGNTNISPGAPRSIRMALVAQF